VLPSLRQRLGPELYDKGLLGRVPLSSGNSVACKTGIMPIYTTMEGGNAMVSHLFFSQLCFGSALAVLQLHSAWPSSHAAGVPRPPSAYHHPEAPSVRSPFLPYPQAPTARPVRRQAVRAHRLLRPTTSHRLPRGRPGQWTHRRILPAAHCAYRAGWGWAISVPRASEWWPLAAILREANSPRGDRYLWDRAYPPHPEGGAAAESVAKVSPITAGLSAGNSVCYHQWGLIVGWACATANTADNTFQWLIQQV